MAYFFDRKNPVVKEDALLLDEEAFIKKYLSQTTEFVLKSVHKEHNKGLKISRIIERATSIAVDLPVGEAETEEPVLKAKIVKKEVPVKKTTVKVEAQEIAGEPKRADLIRTMMIEGLDKDTMIVKLAEKGHVIAKDRLSGEMYRIQKGLNKTK